MRNWHVCVCVCPCRTDEKPLFSCLFAKIIQICPQISHTEKLSLSGQSLLKEKLPWAFINTSSEWICQDRSLADVNSRNIGLDMFLGYPGNHSQSWIQQTRLISDTIFLFFFYLSNFLGSNKLLIWLCWEPRTWKWKFWIRFHLDPHKGIAY